MNLWIYSLVAGAVFLIKFTHLTSWLVRPKKETMALYKNYRPACSFSSLSLLLFQKPKTKNMLRVYSILHLEPLWLKRSYAPAETCLVVEEDAIVGTYVE
jgi:hypothetical protein